MCEEPWVRRPEEWVAHLFGRRSRHGAKSERAGRGWVEIEIEWSLEEWKSRIAQESRQECRRSSAFSETKTRRRGSVLLNLGSGIPRSGLERRPEQEGERGMRNGRDSATTRCAYFMGFRNNKTRAIGKSKNTARYGCGLAIEGQLVVYLIGPRKGGRGGIGFVPRWLKRSTGWCR